jgi:hypothetical protein
MADDLRARPGGGGQFGHALPPGVINPGNGDSPPDPNYAAQVALLNEAVLNSFAADHASSAPFAANTLRWDITMPVRTAANASIAIDVRLDIADDLDTYLGYADNLPAVGIRPVPQRRATTWKLSLTTSEASRLLGTVTIELDMTTCEYFFLDSTIAIAPVKSQVDAGFPSGGQITLATPATIGIHLETLTVNLTLHIDGPLFFNPGANVNVDWTLWAHGPAQDDPWTADAEIVCAISTANTTIDTSFWDSTLSVGVMDAVASAVETVSDGYLLQLVGPLAAQNVMDRLIAIMQFERPADPSGQAGKPPMVFLRLDVTQDGLTFWYCPHP